MEQIIKRNESVTVDFGTQAGIQVPVLDRLNILNPENDLK
jgi:hypothetical protein